MSVSTIGTMIPWIQKRRCPRISFPTQNCWLQKAVVYLRSVKPTSPSQYQIHNSANMIWCWNLDAGLATNIHWLSNQKQTYQIRTVFWDGDCKVTTRVQGKNQVTSASQRTETCRHEKLNMTGPFRGVLLQQDMVETRIRSCTHCSYEHTVGRQEEEFMCVCVIISSQASGLHVQSLNVHTALYTQSDFKQRPPLSSWTVCLGCTRVCHRNVLASSSLEHVSSILRC